MGNPEYSSKAKKFFKDCHELDIKLVTSVITIEEYKVFPYRNNCYEYIESFEHLIRVLNIEYVNIDKIAADKAAQIRAVYKGFKGMDSLQLAAACLKKCDLFLTNDKQLKQFEGIKCITMDDIE
ncbi:MAG: PIN domain-containing protein [Eubacterium sp.]|nr:PIN domain-containing protein [Eubacterium sp.]